MPKLVDHSEQCSQIALAACQAMARRGVDTTMVEIARQAGVTTGMITHYFRSKREIVAAALRLIFERTEARLSIPAPDAEDPLFHILKETLPLDEERQAESAVWVSFWGKVTTDQDLVNVNSTLHQDAEELYARLIRTAWKESSSWHPTVFNQVCSSVLGFLNGLTASAVTSPGSWTKQRQLNSLKLQLELVRNWANQQ